jgi:hypothetical protein
MATRKAKETPAALAAPADPPAVIVNGKGNPVQPSRIGRVLIAGHFHQAVQAELKILAIRERTTLGKLLHEAINGLLEKRGLPTIEELEAKESEN